jgi:chemotaxis signal transduction protein
MIGHSISNGVAAHAAELRIAFDRAFAEPIRFDRRVKEDLLRIRVGAQTCAIRLSEITGLYADRKITPVPGGHSALRGIVGFRGTILPVFDLQVLLGHAGSDKPRWLVICAAAPVALAFGGFEGQLRVSREAIMPRSSMPHASQLENLNYAHEFVRTDNFVGPIMHLPSVLDVIKTSKFEAAPKEK